MYLTLVYLITCHAGPSTHFAAFASELKRQGYQVEILASGPAFKTLSSIGAIDFNPHHLNLNDSDSQEKIASELVQSLKPDGTIMTDVGHPLMAKVQEKVSQQLPNVRRLAYYDNPEGFVPGYSQTATKVMEVAQKVFFANANLTKEMIYSSSGVPFLLPETKRVAIGYYPVESALNLKMTRLQKQAEVRRKFFEQHQIQDQGQKILVYFGGNNETYFNWAFPAFLRLVREANLNPSKYLILFQQHPGAKEKNIDGKLIKNTPLILSSFTSDRAQILSDIALYYQTSMGPQFALAGIPTIQIGHEPYVDVLVKNNLSPSVTTSNALINALNVLDSPQQIDEKKLLESLGVMENWTENLQTALRN